MPNVEEELADRRMPGRADAMRLAFLMGLSVAVAVTGCDDPGLTYTEVKRLDELVTPAELRAFLEVVDHLPGRKLPGFPELYLPPPEWNEERTLPVSDLVEIELRALEDRWQTDKLVDALPESRELDRWLKRKQMTRRQFAGLTLAIGAALSRSTVRENQKLLKLVERGMRKVGALQGDPRPLNTLHGRPEELHDVLHRAAWITRYDRARRLQSVPEGNVHLVLKHWKRLVQIFPASLTQNPFDPIADRLENLGIPFEPMPGTDPLDVLDWDESDAIIGRGSVSLIPDDEAELPQLR